VNDTVASTPAGVVLAGGRSRRLGPGSKALAPLAGKPLISHVLERMAGQANPVLISVQDGDSGLEALGRALVQDIARRHRGPLTGLASAMQRLDAGIDWLLMCPCDAPFLPVDLAERLQSAAAAERRPVAVAHYGGELQPAFSLWNRAVFGDVHRAVMEKGRGGLKRMLRELPHAVAEWETRDVSPFFNVNTPEDLARARQLLDLHAGGI
jgi:molybdopterin-guanine dinucleotide biosynthesis protein A